MGSQRRRGRRRVCGDWSGQRSAQERRREELIDLRATVYSTTEFGITPYPRRSEGDRRCHLSERRRSEEDFDTARWRSTPIPVYLCVRWKYGSDSGSVKVGEVNRR